MNSLRRLVERDTIDLQSGAGTINVRAKTVYFTSTGGAEALVVPDGLFHGHRIRIVHVVDGGSGVISSATTTLAHSVATITLTNAREWAELEWNVTDLASPAWVVVGCSPVAVVA